MEITKEQAIEQIHGRVLAIENDSLEELRKCLNILWPEEEYISNGVGNYYFQHEHRIECWDFQDNNPLHQYIPATELLKILEGEWMPEVGEPVQVSNDNEKWLGLEITYFGKGTNEYPFLVKMESGRVDSWKFCRPIQKKQITIAELFKKAWLNQSEWEVVNE